MLGAVEDHELHATIGQIGSAITEPGDDRTVTYSVGATTSDGQRFRVLRPHARGGLGAVFVALDEELHREVALKQILDSHADDPTSRHRFVNEAEITGGLEHPGVVPVYGLGTYADGRPYYAMRFIRGDSLREAIDQFHAKATRAARPASSDLELRRLLRRFLDVCNAIDYAHSRGVLHRDIKPGNIVIGKYGETLVVDWGVAKATGKSDPSAAEHTLVPSSSSGSGVETLPGSAIGTPAYMSPEQAVGELDRLDARCDVYSLGATLYCLLTGKAPFADEDVGAMLRKVQAGEFAPPRQLNPSIDQALEAVCMKAMSIKPSDRYPTCKALADDIERWLADEPVSAWREPVTRKSRRWVARHGPLVAGAAGLLITATLALAAGTWLLGSANAEIREREEEAEANYLMARHAIDRYFTTVSYDDLLSEPHLDPLRKKLLVSAKDFYEQLVRKSHPKPKLQVELAKAYFHLAIISNEQGSPDAIELAERARRIFEALVGLPEDDQDLRHFRARNHILLAGMYRVNRNEEAEREYAVGIQMLKDLLNVDPNGTWNLAELGSALTHMGYTARVRGELDKARALLTQSRYYLSRAVEIEHSAYFRGQLAWAYQHLNRVERLAGREEEAQEAAHHALEIRRKLVEEFPSNPYHKSELAWSLASIPFDRTTPVADALAPIEEARAIRRKLIEDYPERGFFHFGWASTEIHYANLMWRLGRVDEAEPAFRGVCEYLRRTYANDSAPEDRMSDNLRAFDGLGSLLIATNRLAEAEEINEEACRHWAKLNAVHPQNVEARSGCVRAYQRLSMLKRQLGKPEEAMMWLDKALKATASSGEAYESSAGAESLLPIYITRAELLGSLGRHAEAISDLERVIEQAEGEAKVEYRLLRACAIARSGDHVRATAEGQLLMHAPTTNLGTREYNLSCVDSLISDAIRRDRSLPKARREAMALQHIAAAVDHLERSRQASFFQNMRNVTHMGSDPDLDPLRAEPLFRRFVAELTFPSNPFAR
jgi:serine/threonine-protein kinase